MQSEVREMSEQLAQERELVGGSSTRALFTELVMVPSNRKRAFIVVMLMIWQQLTGVNSVVGMTRLHDTRWVLMT